MKGLTLLERLNLSLQYSISKKHQKSLLERIAELEGKKKKRKVIQESFI